MNTKYSYDYEDLIREIEEELNEGSLTLDSTVQVLRNKEFRFKNLGYFPIVDWYYNHDKMLDILNTEVFDEEYDLDLKRKLRMNYNLYRNQLHQMTVKEMLLEMKSINKI